MISVINTIQNKIKSVIEADPDFALEEIPGRLSQLGKTLLVKSNTIWGLGYTDTRENIIGWIPYDGPPAHHTDCVQQTIYFQLWVRIKQTSTEDQTDVQQEAVKITEWIKDILRLNPTLDGLVQGIDFLETPLNETEIQPTQMDAVCTCEIACRRCFEQLPSTGYVCEV